ncbi:16S rRNA (adenine(1518)-N(6)/adenine(1519)-N(6))-dimethyltransferase RsmA [Blochmannia endosymbiont of Colobopsis nipponica]|uniref:16S rRNA (adenine(1518)-N(6)/adenine(1519)-N(6))- dimethyltransferase RsmA n=1 Tax=Blochmannia endosymbiont of Colobopsis nipponica TaxID=2681987 RepID=UPI00177AE160|nr:16S rRNA (adenine(1518)-N(6)/adenine(1519)-N(6))-dimethyltransferase RsmA [Blochmannia endosymbiont of Colobopsis nipponica]QOI11281.1 16S rRNA (adenine(1518)-N(6)/adenine(1519)-N(6))-dimethyltransferase RsmA [Blochmannia endosymbiont of Colobopsis nipponica]
MKKIIYQNHQIKKKFGQNFLNDQHIIDLIIYYISPKNNENLIEVGPGLGALTKRIAKYVNHLTAIEIDKDLVQKLKKSLSHQKNIKILHKNVMSINFQNLSNKIGESLRIFGNLPYNISTQLIFHLLKYINVIQDMHFMLQKEIADRLIAMPNNKNYGILSIMVQYFCTVFHLTEVPSKSFIPNPKVNSTFIRLTPHNNKPYLANNLKNLSIIVKTAFKQRRKIIKNSLKNLLNTKQIIKQGIDPTLRAENLDIKQFCLLSNVLNIN